MSDLLSFLILQGLGFRKFREDHDPASYIPEARIAEHTPETSSRTATV